MGNGFEFLIFTKFTPCRTVIGTEQLADRRLAYLAAVALFPADIWSTDAVSIVITRLVCEGDPTAVALARWGWWGVRERAERM